MLAQKMRQGYRQSSKFFVEAAEDFFLGEFDRPAVKRIAPFNQSQIASHRIPIPRLAANRIEHQNVRYSPFRALAAL